MLNKKLIEAIKRHFEARLQVKTGWGRNDVMAEFNAAVNDALLEILNAE